MSEKKFAEGIYFEKRNGSPAFVVGKLSVKAEKFIPFIQANVNNGGYVNMNIMKGREEGKFYIEVDTWQPKGANNNNNTVMNVDYPESDINFADSPF